MNYTIPDIIRYFSDEMSETEMYELEKASFENPFFAHALEGYRNMDLEDLKKLQSDVDSLLEPEVLAKKVIQKESLKADLQLSDENINNESEIEEIQYKEQKPVQSKTLFSKSKIFRYAIGIAATLILAISGYYYFNRQATDYLISVDIDQYITSKAKINFDKNMRMINYQKLFDEGKYYECIATAKEKFNSNISIRDSIKLNALIARSFILLNMPDSAINLIEHLSSDAKNDCDVQFVFNLTLLKKRNYTSADDGFKMVARNCNSHAVAANEITDYIGKIKK